MHWFRNAGGHYAPAHSTETGAAPAALYDSGETAGSPAEVNGLVTSDSEDVLGSSDEYEDDDDDVADERADISEDEPIDQWELDEVAMPVVDPAGVDDMHTAGGALAEAEEGVEEEAFIVVSPADSRAGVHEMMQANQCMQLLML